MLDVICIGDTTLDVFLKIEDAKVICDINREACKLSMRFGDKIPVNNVTNIPAVGSAPNVAIGLARMGLSSAIYTILGNDGIGESMYEVLHQQKVSMEYVQFDPKKGSDYSVVLVYEGERTILVYHEKRKYKLPVLEPAKWMFYGSIGQDSKILNNQILKYLKQYKTKLVLNLGPSQLKLGASGLKSLLKETEIIFLNKAEAWRLAGKKRSIKSLLKAVFSLGPKMVIVTDGKAGSYFYDGKIFYHMPGNTIKNGETTGCGDAYVTGFISALNNNESIKVAMKWGASNSLSVLHKIGAQSGLLTKRKLKNALLKNKRNNPKII